jgi:Ca2+-binding EF-hand superfamily protein
MVWCVINAYAIFECFDELCEMGFNESTFIVQPLSNPTWLSVNNLSTVEITKLKQLILNRMDKSTSSLYRNSLNSMLTYLDSNFNKNIEHTLEKLAELNKRRKLNFSNFLSYLH